MNQLDPKQPVSLEDLLHLKRAERPPEEFWLQFESELRAKQLAAIVDRRPWWSSWRQFSGLLARQSLPIGATAVLALGLMSYQGYRMHTISSVVAIPAAPVPAAVAANPATDRSESAPAVASEAADQVSADGVMSDAAPLAANDSAHSAATAAGRATNSAAAQVASSVPSDPFSALVGSPNTPAAATQSDAWNHFGDKQLASNSLASTVGFTPRAFATPVSEPLAQMATPLDERRAMLLSGSLPRADNAADEATPLTSDDHSASQISDDRLYESVRRLGLGGNRLSIRF